jgi:hypothetical protein
MSTITKTAETVETAPAKGRAFDVKYTAIQMEAGESSSGLNRFRSEAHFMDWLRQQIAERRAITVVQMWEL